MCGAKHVTFHAIPLRGAKRVDEAIRRRLLDARTKSGTTPLHWAAYHSHAQTFMALLSHGANLHATDNEGETPLTLIEARGTPEAKATLKDFVVEARRQGGEKSGAKHDEV